MTAQPADEATTDLTAVLAAHASVQPSMIRLSEDRTAGESGHYHAVCACGAELPWGTYRNDHAHLAHLAEVLAPLIRAERAAALDEAKSVIAETPADQWGIRLNVGTGEAEQRGYFYGANQAIDFAAMTLTARAEAERRGEPNG